MTLSRLQIWILAARPKTLPAAVAPVLIGTTLAYAVEGFYWPAAVAAMVAALLIQIGTNIANDYFDFQKGSDNDDRLGPLRVTQSGLVSPATMKLAMVVVFTLALMVGVYLVYRGGWPIVVIGLLSILFGLMYTGGPFPLGYHGLGELFVLIFFGPVAVAGTYYVQTLTFSVTAVMAGLAPGLFSVGILAVNNLRDIDSDRAADKKTLAVRFGRRFAVGEFLVAILTACLVPLAINLMLSPRPMAMLALLTIIPAAVVIRKVLSVSGAELNNCLAATGRLLLIYTILFSAGWLI